MIPSHHLNGLIYPDFAAFCSSGISWCITYPAPLHTSKDPSPCTPSSSELLPMPPFSAWFSVCPDMPQLVRSTSFQKATDVVFDSLSARPTWRNLTILQGQFCFLRMLRQVLSKATRNRNDDFSTIATTTGWQGRAPLRLAGPWLFKDE